MFHTFCIRWVLTEVTVTRAVVVCPGDVDVAQAVAIYLSQLGAPRDLVHTCYIKHPACSYKLSKNNYAQSRTVSNNFYKIDISTQRPYSTCSQYTFFGYIYDVLPSDRPSSGKIE